MVTTTSETKLIKHKEVYQTIGAGHLGAVSFFFELWRKNNEAGNSLNVVEREPVPTRVLNIETRVLQTETT